MAAMPLLILAAYAALVWLMLKRSERRSVVRLGWLAMLLAGGPAASFAIGYALSALPSVGGLNEGTAAFYALPLMLVIVPYIGVVAQALVILRSEKTERSWRVLVLLVASAALLSLPWAFMAIQPSIAHKG